MRLSAVTFPLLSLLVLGHGTAAESAKPTASSLDFSLPAIESLSGSSNFSAAQLAYVQSWIKEKAPECPASLLPVVADNILEELRLRHPGKLDQLLTADFPAMAFESMLLRQVAAKMTGAAQGPLREELARRRVAALRTAGGLEPRTALAESTGLIAAIKDTSSSQYRRLVEGKIEDEDLEFLLKKAARPEAASQATAPVKPKVVTATDIVSEFSRRNQAGSALQRLQAYMIAGELKTATGEVQELLIFKQRPDRFRLVMRMDGLTRYILAADGERYWQQAPGQAPRLLTPEAMGSRLYLTEFSDPLFSTDGYHYTRLEDGVIDGRKTYRIEVRRSDQSKYIAAIDQESYQEVARENDDHTMARYSDFREVAGVTYAFREEVTDQAGRKGVLKLTRLTPNPGLIQEIFDLPSVKNMSYFEVERLLATASATVGKSNP